MLALRIPRLECQNGFILATNQLDCQAWSDEELILAYKNQLQVERSFRFLKDPYLILNLNEHHLTLLKLL